MHGLCGVALAAGAGSRLWPLTSLRPKPLCPVNNEALIDLALERLREGLPGGVDAEGQVAVNLHHGLDQLDAHLPRSVHRSFEPRPLGTAGALALLRPWIDGRDVLVTNSDAWLGGGPDLGTFVSDWDHERARLLCVDTGAIADFGSVRYSGVALLPSAMVGLLDVEPSGLYEAMWADQAASNRLDLVIFEGEFVDCGTPRDYLRANLAASGGRSVVDPTALVQDGATLVRSVVWDHSEVGANEVLVDAIRARGSTILVR